MVSNEQIMSELQLVKRTLEEHIADEDHMLDDWRSMRPAHEASALATTQLIAGQAAIMARLDENAAVMKAMQAELKSNTEITSAMRDAGTVIGTLRKWLMWIGPVVILVCGIAYGVWQLSIARQGIGT